MSSMAFGRAGGHCQQSAAVPGRSGHQRGDEGRGGCCSTSPLPPRATSSGIGEEAGERWQTRRRTVVDLSKIDFKTLKAHFDKGQSGRSLKDCGRRSKSGCEQMVRLNQSRHGLPGEVPGSMIDEYNSGSRNIEQFFKELTVRQGTG